MGEGWMKKVLFLVAVLLVITGCVKIEAPDHLVADTVEVGKDAYNSIKRKLSKNDPADENSIFSYKYIIQDGDLIGESTSKCISGAVETARKALNVYNIEVEKTVTNSVIEEGKLALECSVVIAK